MPVFEVIGGSDRRSLIKRFERKSKHDAVSELVDFHLLHCSRIERLEAEIAELRAGQVAQAGQVPDGYTGWVTQYPGRAAKLWGSREIAELNWWPEDGQQLFRVVEVERIDAAPAQGVQHE